MGGQICLAKFPNSTFDHCRIFFFAQVLKLPAARSVFLAFVSAFACLAAFQHAYENQNGCPSEPKEEGGVCLAGAKCPRNKGHSTEGEQNSL